MNQKNSKKEIHLSNQALPIWAFKRSRDPNVEGRDGKMPLMVCLVPLVNSDHLHHFTHRQHWYKWSGAGDHSWQGSSGTPPGAADTHPTFPHGVTLSISNLFLSLNFRYDLLDMLLQEGGDPNVEGRDGSLPLMVCLVPLVNRDHLHHFTHTMKVCYLNCVRILLKYGANPNCSSRSNLTPLHVLNFAATGI